LFIKFFIEDTGIGIAEENKEMIFETFRQVDDTYTRTFGGTGIGLSISKKLTELLGGNIWFDTKINKGSTFYFTIPYVKVNIITKPAKIAQKLSVNFSNKTMLIVEDDNDSFEFLNIVLKQLDINTLWAKDGEEAIIMCKRNASIDIVLMDINMDVMNGYIATAEIKKFRPELPIIAQTALAMVGDKEKALDAGCDDYISKPIDKDKLMDIISKRI
jgi:CheY-like chemotaxis protein